MLETAAHLLSLDFPAEFAPGARSAVNTCLRIQPEEKVTLITDRATEAIAASIAHELESCGCRWNGFVLEDLAPRPLTDMPAAILADMETSQVSIFAVMVQSNGLHGDGEDRHLGSFHISEDGGGHIGERARGNVLKHKPIPAAASRFELVRNGGRNRFGDAIGDQRDLFFRLDAQAGVDC